MTSASSREDWQAMGKRLASDGIRDGEVRREDAARRGDFIAGKSRHSRREAVVFKALLSNC